jgi:pseudouridine-5'-phosphate glycosidase
MHRLTRVLQQLQPMLSEQHAQSSPCLASASAACPASLGSNLRIAPEVAASLAAGRAVVALESTIISHGMPFPRNVETALAVERAARDAGATPATIAILDGIIHVGLEPAQLDKLARLGPRCSKCSRRDLALLVSRRANGATTVAATMLIASWAGIPLFVTGGIGGVHRGGESSMDISADLSELGRTNVAVVCAGVKSILDIGRTLEVLETQGVAVVTIGSDEFPAVSLGRNEMNERRHCLER